MPVSRPASSSAQPSSKPVHAGVGAQAGHVGAAVVEAEPEAAAQLREPGFGADRRVQLTDPRPQVGTFPPARPDSGDATMLRTLSCVADGSSPAWLSRGAITSPTAATSVIPRTCTLPRAVSSSVPEPNALETPASVANCAAVSMPPGSRIRAIAPSAA